MYLHAPMGFDEKENSVQPTQGCVAFNPNSQWSAICIFWGSDLAEKDNYHNLFARIKGDMDHLYAVGTRIWQKGGENVTIKRID